MNNKYLQKLLREVSKQSGVRERHIQNVDMKDKFSFMDLPEKAANGLIKRQGLKIANRKVNLEISNR